MVLAILMVALLTFGTYTRRIHVTGHLTPATGLISVNARTAASVEAVLVSEGTHVSVGQQLAVLSSDRSSQALGPTAAGVAQTLRGDHDRFLAQIGTAKSLNAKQGDALRLKQATAKAQLEQLNAQILLQDEQIDIQQTMLEKVKPLLIKGYISAFQVQQQQAQFLTAKADLQSLLRQRSDTAQALNEASAQLAQLPLELEGKLSDIKGQISASNQALAQAEADRAVILVAPRAGMVTSLLAKPGQAVIPGQAIANLVPDNSPLIAEFLVKSEAIGFIRMGTRVTMHMSSFPYQKFGTVSGIVSALSPSALSPDEAMAMLGQPQVEQEPMYRVDVRLAAQGLRVNDRNEPLRVGMGVDADMLLDRRRLIEWMFEPLIGVSHEWREDVP